MFVLTVDQVDSRAHADLVERAVREVSDRHAEELVMPAERTAGDEFQAAVDDAGAVLDIVLGLTREGWWSVGVGVGGVRHPLPASTREATGDAYYAARAAVDRAKRAQTRFALQTVAAAGEAADLARDCEALIDLLLSLRERRTDGGWEIADLLASGMSQKQAAESLGITASAASLRIKAAGIRLEERSVVALRRLLERLGTLAA
jgi:hypothetical protein